jgi:hypothetical protein
VEKMTIAQQVNIVVECIVKNVLGAALERDVEAIQTALLDSAVTTRQDVQQRKRNATLAKKV